MVYRQRCQSIYENVGSDELSNVPETLDHETRVKIQLAYTLIHPAQRGSEHEFSKAVMSLLSSERCSVLDGAMSKFIERAALEDCKFSGKLTEKDRQRYVEKSLRGEYRLFSQYDTSEALSSDSEAILMV